MRRWMVILIVIVSAGMARASAAEESKPFSLEYCPTTPIPATTTGQIPGALTAKFSPRLSDDLKMYIGTGLAYSLPAPKDATREVETGLKTGVAGQAGVDYKLSGHTSINLDYKYLHLMQDPVRGGGEVSRSPHLLGLRLLCNF